MNMLTQAAIASTTILVASTAALAQSSDVGSSGSANGAGYDFSQSQQKGNAGSADPSSGGRCTGGVCYPPSKKSCPKPVRQGR